MNRLRRRNEPRRPLDAAHQVREMLAGDAGMPAAAGGNALRGGEKADRPLKSAFFQRPAAFQQRFRLNAESVQARFKGGPFPRHRQTRSFN